MEAIKNLLKEINLDNKEINIYLNLLKIWTSPSSIISNKVWIPKSTVRYSLENLVKKGLILKNQKWNTTLFTAEHPAKLKNLLIIKKNKLENTEKKLDNLMWKLVEIYNPYTKLPKVTFYEWIEWIEKVLNDSLTSTEVIDTYVDIDSVWKHISSLNKKYTEKRKKLNIEKRAILSDSQFSKKYIEEVYSNVNDKLNDIKLLDPEKYDLHVSFMLYDWKISYITMEDWIFVWIIIQNKQIYNFHKNLFKLNWESIK